VGRGRPNGSTMTVAQPGDLGPGLPTASAACPGARQVRAERWLLRWSADSIDAGDVVFDEPLVERVRERLEHVDGVVELKMFGGWGVTVRGNMAVGVMDRDLIVRVGPDSFDEALTRPGARPFDFTGRPMTGWLYVAGSAVQKGRSRGPGCIGGRIGPVDGESRSNDCRRNRDVGDVGASGRELLRPLHRREHWLSLGVPRPTHRTCSGMNGHERWSPNVARTPITTRGGCAHRWEKRSMRARA